MSIRQRSALLQKLSAVIDRNIAEVVFRYFVKQASNARDIETIRGLSADILEDLDTRFALSEDEKAHFDKIAKDNFGYITINDCREFLEKR